ncbi:Lipoprotein-releasing system ATP-binding protein LolD (modular protein) [Candidatus Promineifilum breve]|uniref:Lipoprotein-releasing system ATP-binding protein LolD (Modular protein) n=1 Tax=Candidatus Promineifilum breve TaxID=1806508 RepID=A0A161K3F2_9CHLR|nr:Lipoprotein-releasing system ATP-binding protein LolD (modular protein) [Candidatus Promineifilum breve]
MTSDGRVSQVQRTSEGASHRPYVEARRLTKVYRTPAGEFTALKGIDLQVQRGEFVAVIGKSGSGKSTLINLLTGIDRPTAGEVIIGGEPLHTYDEEQLAAWRGRNMGIVFQFFQLLPTLTLVENVMLPMDINRLYPPAERRERAMLLLEMVELAEQAGKRPSQVSGGQQQRVAIARALANDPGLLIADEPTGNLDSATAESIFGLFARLAAEGTTILMVTHDETLAARTHRAVMIADGEVVNEHVSRALWVLNYDQLAEVQRHVTPITYAPGSVIIRQGEMGEHFYILTGGRADVFVEHPDGHEMPVDHLRAGQYFGEMALIGRQARRATVRAADDGPVEVAALDRAAFNALVEASPGLRHELQRVISLRQLQSEVDALQDVDRATLQRLTADAPTRLIAPGETIIRRGELGETFYFILEGAVEVFAGRNGQEALIDRLGPGAHFGELALLGNRRRVATVRAAGDGPARLIELDETAFAQLRQLSARFAGQVEQTAAERQARI